MSAAVKSSEQLTGIVGKQDCDFRPMTESQWWLGIHETPSSLPWVLEDPPTHAPHHHPGYDNETS
jgi:hypothetical protein